ncbi:MAG TPA: hypothetical protein VG838_15140 [Opitutaceae bacterium]|nr:hypothetical protein [Opitutaceae bacterium]
MKYEHNVAILQFDKKTFSATRSGVLKGLTAQSMEELAALGAAGWEMVSVIPYVMGETVLVRHPGTDVALAFFKRAKG